jgi:hypothetical protein
MLLTSQGQKQSRQIAQVQKLRPSRDGNRRLTTPKVSVGDAPPGGWVPTTWSYPLPQVTLFAGMFSLPVSVLGGAINGVRSKSKHPTVVSHFRGGREI